MASLYNRATISQKRVLRIVEGAVKNAVHAHPDREISRAMARSIAKRAAGTLTAEWPDVLAARVSRRSGRTEDQISNHRPQGAHVPKRLGRGAPDLALRRSPLQQAWKLLSFEIGVADRSGNEERKAALVHAIRVVAAIDKIDRFPLACET